jgi:hypothetical protein
MRVILTIFNKREQTVGYMPSISRRALLVGMGAVLTGFSGCTALSSFPSPTEEESNPHWVNLYPGDREEVHHVTVTITNKDGDTFSR